MFIAFDGMDGAGKNTQMEAVRDYLERRGYNVVQLDFGGSPYFCKYLKMINDGLLQIPAEIRELIYYFEGLFTNINCIQNSVNSDVILIDRYYLSYFAYGIENGVSENEIAFFTQNLIEPDLYFFLDCDVNETLNRIKKYRTFDAAELGYKERKHSVGMDEEKRFILFQTKVRENYKKRLKPSHFLIDASKPVEIVTEEILNAIKRVV